MSKILKFLAISLVAMSFTIAKAEINFGVGLIGGTIEVDGTETEGGETNSKSIESLFGGADVFVENTFDSGFLSGYTLGVSYVPFDIDLGSGSRQDDEGDDVAENDTGHRSASAEAEDLMTIYANVPFGSNGMYALLGAHFTTITTKETLVNSSYGNKDIMGGQVGLGLKTGSMKVELAYSDFEDIKLTGTGGDNSQSIAADADALTLRVSYSF